MLPLLVAELGMAQGWLGDLTEAEVNLTTAVTLSRARGLTGLTTACLSHLALTLYMQGRESACIEIANDALAQLPTDDGRPGHVRARAELARQLAMLCDVPWPDGMALTTAAPDAPMPLHVGDPVGRFWARLRDARLALMAGSVSAAEQILEVPPTWFPMPEHLRVVLVLERGFLASLAGDAQALRSWADELRLAGRPRRGAAADRAAARAGERPQGRARRRTPWPRRT